MKDPLNKRLARYIEREGKSYQAALLPEGVERGPLGYCYDWCLALAMRHPEYRYVEGIAEDPEHPGRWILHAWLTDGKHAFDPTWQATNNAGEDRILPVEYIGIEMRADQVLKFILKVGNVGVLAGREENRSLYEEIIDPSKPANLKHFLTPEQIDVTMMLVRRRAFESNMLAVSASLREAGNTISNANKLLKEFEAQ